MKHIKKKYLFETEVTERHENLLSNSIKFTESEYDKLKTTKDWDKKVPMVVLEGGTMVKAFTSKIDKHIYFIPEPNLVLVYFNCAQQNYRLLATKRDELLTNLKPDSYVNENIHAQIYNYIGYAVTTTLFLFTSIEGMINQVTPHGFIYEDVQNNRTVVYNKKQLERLDFNTKLDLVLPKATGKSFKASFGMKRQKLTKLKELRDELVHLKFNPEYQGYKNIITQVLRFKFDESIYIVRDLINFYSPKLIEECDCGLNE